MRPMTSRGPVFSERSPPLPFFMRKPPEEALPFARAGVQGFHHGDAIELADLKRAGVWLRGRVIAALPRLKLIVIRLDGPEGDRRGIIELNPLHHAHMIRKAHAP